MRPAQIAREIPMVPPDTLEARESFNEARANCAGNCFQRRVGQLRRLSFNEARANCAGNYSTRSLRSMARPKLQ